MKIEEKITKTLESYVEPHGYDEQKIINAEYGFECLVEELVTIFNNRAEKLDMSKTVKVNKELLKLCEKEFTNTMIQPYAGARQECLYCGAMYKEGKVEHKKDCPVIKYQEILSK